jgi:hypothetical protein
MLIAITPDINCEQAATAGANNTLHDHKEIPHHRWLALPPSQDLQEQSRTVS